MDSSYTPPLALTVISGVFLAFGALCLLCVATDIVLRRGWQSMMWIMIPAYIINAAYMGPITVYVYWRYGRPAKPSPDKPAVKSCHSKEYSPPTKSCHNKEASSPPKSCHAEQSQPPTKSCHNQSDASAALSENKERDLESGDESSRTDSNDQQAHHNAIPTAQYSTTPATPSCHAKPAATDDSTPHCHSAAKSRPMLATIAVGVCHCGAGCVLGDLVGEWLVYGTGAEINGHSIWAELLIDYGFALFFGIIFQYFSIAPMSGEYGPKTLWRAAKADILSLTSFEVGAFSWMIIYQVGIWDYKLDMMTWTYWWMMQMGMMMGFATAMPMNYFLIKYKIKEPCC